MMSGRRMPLYMQRQLCRYIRAAASVPLCMKRQLYTAIDTQRQLPLYTQTVAQLQTLRFPSRETARLKRAAWAEARGRAYITRAPTRPGSHTRAAFLAVMGVPIFFGSPYSQILKGHVEQGHVLRRQGHTLREARLLLVPEPKQRIIHPQSRGRRQVLAPALCSQKMASLREKPARSHAPVRLAEW